MGKFMVPNPATGLFTAVQDNIGNYSVLNSTSQINDYILKGLNFSLSIYNIFDTKYYSQDNQHLNQPTQPGRQLLINLVYSFR